jgi:beta-glucanase (GH16 family)
MAENCRILRTDTIRYTNQCPGCPDDNEMQYGTAPVDVTSAIHEYGIDWTPGSTKYYIDGVLQYEFTEYVPDGPLSFILNIWVNGDPYWTLGPPEEDAVLKITQVTLAYNEEL